MALRHIITLPDPKLRLISKPLERVDDSVRKLLDDMVETMHEAPGIGLAAIQIAEAYAPGLMDLAKKDEPHAAAVLHQSRRSSGRPSARSTKRAACRSPNITRRSSGRRTCACAPRPRRQAAGDPRRGSAGDLLQHEIDHLDGVLFIDHISKLKRDRVTKKFAKMAKRAEGHPPL